MRIIDFEIGCRWFDTWIWLRHKIKHIECDKYASDNWNVYKEFLPKEKHHIGKDETRSVEWMNNLIRHYLARFHRRTHCYSKATHMIYYTLLLFMYWKQILSMIT